jgi:hypothetical protein
MLILVPLGNRLPLYLSWAWIRSFAHFTENLWASKQVQLNLFGFMYYIALQ